MRLGRRSLVVGAAAAFAVGCAGSTTVPIETIEHPGRDADAERILAILLPGFGDDADAFAEHGLVRTLQEGRPGAHVIGVGAHFGYYRERQLVERVTADILDPRVGRQERTWIVGVSMGGLGALLTAQRHPDRIDGLVLLSPYLGKKKVSAQVQASGGLSSWPPPQDGDYTVTLWRWLKGYTQDGETRPPLYLAHGEREHRDGFNALAGALPPERLVVSPGGHDWPTWKTALAELLSRGALR